LIGRNCLNLIVSWCGQFLFSVVPRQFSQGIGKWPENQILIPDWTYFHCPGASLPINRMSMVSLGLVSKTGISSCSEESINKAVKEQE